MTFNAALKLMTLGLQRVLGASGDSLLRWLGSTTKIWRTVESVDVFVSANVEFCTTNKHHFWVVSSYICHGCVHDLHLLLCWSLAKSWQLCVRDVATSHQIPNKVIKQSLWIHSYYGILCEWVSQKMCNFIDINLSQNRTPQKKHGKFHGPSYHFPETNAITGGMFPVFFDTPHEMTQIVGEISPWYPK